MMHPSLPLLLLLLAAPAAAQPVVPDEDPPAAEILPDPVVPSPAPAQPEPGAEPEAALDLDALLTALARADARTAEPLQRKIMSEWARDESDAMTLLLTRATRAMKADDLDRALGFLDDLVRLAPDFAEGRNRRATIHFMRKDYGRAVADIQRVLALEPRHFGALSGLGIILDRLERKPEALRVFRRALAIHPHLAGAQAAVDRLTPVVEGQPL